MNYKNYSGVVKQKNNYYAIRILTDFGYVKPDFIIKLATIAKKYTTSDLSLTSRGTIEIIGLKEEVLKNIIEELESNNISLGGTGKKVRFILTCKSEQCPYGLAEVKKIATSISESLPSECFSNKFKIGVFGCQNSLGKAMSQDIGFLPFLKNGQLFFKVFIGGRMGKKVSLGKELSFFISQDKIVSLVLATVSFYKKEGRNNERFSETLSRVSFSYVDSLLKNSLN